VTAVDFVLPDGSEAAEPPERRGLRRDGVRLLVAQPSGVEHRRFSDLPDLLEPGDLVVVNTSATLAAALDVERVGEPAVLHVAGVLDDGDWVVELRLPDGPDLTARAGERLTLPGDLRLRLRVAYPDPSAGRSRLWRATPSRKADVVAHLAAHGRPIGYRYLSARYPLSDSQTVFALEPGSAEMPSAGRPFTADTVLRLVTRGVAVAPLLLHTGVSSPEAHEPPAPERYAVPAATARAVESTRAAGGRVVAVGTTVVRALETVAAPDGSVRAGRGWTDLVLGPERPARAVSGLVTGLHAPEASHLLLLEAVVGRQLLREAYEAAVARRYLWHEFGDSSLFLP
jgi:S-adenosylmethionine:tRNA ribosyltransferase-isomerase